MEYNPTTPGTGPPTTAVGGNGADEPVAIYGYTRKQRRSVSYEQVDRAAREVMAGGERPTVQTVRKAIGRGSPQHIAADLQRFWKNQAALQASDPPTLRSLPPEIADAARAQWELALLLAQKTAQSDDNAARAQLKLLKQENELRARSLELREKEWVQAVRERERALAETRAIVNELMQALAINRQDLQEHQARIADLESQIDGYRGHIANLIASAIAKNQALIKSKSPHPRQSARNKRSMSQQQRPENRSPAQRKR
jgi:transketolase